MPLVQLPPEAVVNIDSPEVPIVVKPAERRDPTRPLPATTTYQEDLTTHGQRRINMVWEFTQAGIAVMVVFSNMIVAVKNGWSGLEKGHPVILSSALFLIVGFYFARTNHTAIGGVGKKPNEEEYRGR